MPISQRAGGTITLQASEIEIGSVEIEGAGTATLSNVNDSATTQTILALNTSRKNAIVVNDSVQFLYLAYAATATTTAFTWLISPGQNWNMLADTGWLYTGVLSGIWVADGDGAARITELT